MKTCDYCGHENSADAETCCDCGQTFSSPKPPQALIAIEPGKPSASRKRWWTIPLAIFGCFAVLLLITAPIAINTSDIHEANRIAEIPGLFLGTVFLIALSYGLYCLIRRSARAKPVHDFHRWRALAIPGAGFLVSITIMVLLDSLLSEDGRGATFRPVSDLALVGGIRLSDVNFLLWIGVGIVMFYRSRSVRVLIFRRFATDNQAFLTDFLPNAMSPLGRVDAFQSEATPALNLVGQPKDRWREGLPKLLQKARWAVVDVTEVGENLAHELTTLRSFRHVKVIRIYRRGHDADAPLPLSAVPYQDRLDNQFVVAFLDAVERAAMEGPNALRFGWRWRRHRKVFLKAFAKGLIPRVAPYAPHKTAAGSARMEEDIGA